MKKLITLVSTSGKTSEEIMRELLNDLPHHQARKKGLRQCKVCGEYRGWAGRLKVECLCSGVTCPKCKTNAVHRPTTNYYDIETQKVWHVPYFKSICTECNDERKANTEIEKYYEEKRAYFAILSDAELIELERKSKRNSGWVATRAYYETALSEELKRRGLQLPE
jgi:hypothetical protein